VFEDELERLFTRAWLFVGHTSLIPKPIRLFRFAYGHGIGHSPAATLRTESARFPQHVPAPGHESLPLRSGQHDALHLSLSRVELRDDGKLVGVPLYEQIYAGIMDKASAPLIEVAQMVDYKGTILGDLGSAGAAVRSVHGRRARLSRPGARFTRRPPRAAPKCCTAFKVDDPSNWKFSAENFSGDRYHNVSHRSADDVRISPSARSV